MLFYCDTPLAYQITLLFSDFDRKTLNLDFCGSPVLHLHAHFLSTFGRAMLLKSEFDDPGFSVFRYKNRHDKSFAQL